MKTLLLFSLSFVLSQNTMAQSKSDRELTLHVMNRMAFGPRAQELQDIEKGGRTALIKWIHQQLNPDEIQDPSLEHKLKELVSLDMETKDLYIHYGKEEKLKAKGKEIPDDLKSPRVLVNEMQTAKLIRAVESKKQLEEVLLHFWFNHFNVDITKADIKFKIADYQEETIRPRLFGKFEDLLLATPKV